MDHNEEINIIIEKHGFNNYVWINASQIVVAQWVRAKCKFGCGDYGLGTCPPNTFEVEECRAFFREYKKAVIIILNKYIDKSVYPSDWSKEMTRKLLEVEKHVFHQGFYKAFLLNQTCCSLCKECAGNRLECKDKKNSRPSPEAFAVDVYDTLRNAGKKIDVVTCNPSEIKRVAILMID